jgi:hypothetical protein
LTSSRIVTKTTAGDAPAAYIGYWEYLCYDRFPEMPPEILNFTLGGVARQWIVKKNLYISQLLLINQRWHLTASNKI